MRTFLFTLSFALVACGGGDTKTAEPAKTTEPAKTEAAPTPPPTETTPAVADAGATAGAAAGAAAFDAMTAYSTVCTTCHGVNGDGNGPAGAALNPKPANFTDAAFWASRKDEDLAKAIKEGGAAVGKSAMMAPYGAQYNDEQIKLIVEYLKTFKKG